MKRISIIFFALIALVSCNKISVNDSQNAQYDASKLNFNLDVRMASDTKAVKTDWARFDKLWIFFEGKTGGYLEMTYDMSGTGAGWGTPSVHGSLTLDATGELFAIFLPYWIEGQYPTFSGSSWTFDSRSTDSYYLAAKDVAYEITDTEDVSTLSTATTINMTLPTSGYVQIFVPDASAANGTNKISCNAVKPAGIASISSVGDITENDGTAGDFLTGYVKTISGAKGYYASGKLVAEPGNDYYFAMEFGENYYDYYRHLDTPLASGAAVKLTSKHQVGAGYYVQIGDAEWCTINHAINTTYYHAVPWQYSGTKFTWPGADAAAWATKFTSYPLPTGDVIPTRVNFQSLNSNSNSYWLRVGGVNGRLFVDSTDLTKYLFIPAAPTSGQTPGTEGVLWSCTAVDGSSSYGLQVTSSVRQTRGFKNTNQAPVRTVKGAI